MRIGACLKTLVISCVALSISPVFAEDTSTQISQNAGSTSPAKTKQSSSGGYFERLGKNTVKLPVATVSFVVGTVVGTPVSIARHSVNEVHNAGKGIYDGLHNPFSAPLVLVLGGPAILAGAFGGAVCLGPWTAMENSWANAMDKPFSKDSFSLGALDKEVQD